MIGVSGPAERPFRVRSTTVSNDGSIPLRTRPLDLDAEDFSDAELTALALAADLDAPLDPEAVPIDRYLMTTPGLLPSWYMAPATARGDGGRWRLPIILMLIGTFFLIEAVGLCSTYGQLPFH